MFARRAPRRLIRFVRKAAGIAHDFYFITVAAAVVMSAASSTAHFAGGPGRGPRVDVYMVFLMYGGPPGCRATVRRPEGPPYLRKIEIDPRTPARPQPTGPLSEGSRLKDQQAVNGWGPAGVHGSMFILFFRSKAALLAAVPRCGGRRGRLT